MKVMHFNSFNIDIKRSGGYMKFRVFRGLYGCLSDSFRILHSLEF
jgi:hypothetical protein